MSYHVKPRPLWVRLQWLLRDISVLPPPLGWLYRHCPPLSQQASYRWPTNPYWSPSYYGYPKPATLAPPGTSTKAKGLIIRQLPSPMLPGKSDMVRPSPLTSYPWRWHQLCRQLPYLKICPRHHLGHWYLVESGIWSTPPWHYSPSLPHN